MEGWFGLIRIDGNFVGMFLVGAADLEKCASDDSPDPNTDNPCAHHYNLKRHTQHIDQTVWCVKNVAEATKQTKCLVVRRMPTKTLERNITV